MADGAPAAGVDYANFSFDDKMRIYYSMRPCALLSYPRACFCVPLSSALALATACDGARAHASAVARGG